MIKDITKLACTEGQFASSTAFTCVSCPTGCTKCSEEKKVITCTECTLTTTLNDKTKVCDQKCIGRTYFDPKTTKCESCDPSCFACSGPGNSKATCSLCIVGYELGESGCQPELLDNVTCGVGTYIEESMSENNCFCIDKTQVFDEEDKSCKTLEEYFSSEKCK